jgi:hypothetical protein
MLKRNALLFGKRTLSVVNFLNALKQGKHVLYMHPEFVAMSWEDFRKLQEKNTKVLFDEAVSLEQDQLFVGEHIPEVNAVKELETAMEEQFNWRKFHNDLDIALSYCIGESYKEVGFKNMFSISKRDSFKAFLDFVYKKMKGI